ncbi:MAG TPA: DsrE/DsrF/DrsH-like family protein [Rhodospirillales bacterium]|jgi:peroxiredoxin family protein|nr:DsrE/DsrF/DrsH-like family protein [Rhodospirillales bacterium]
MPADSTSPPDKLSLVVYSGDFDKLHYALAMAAAAAAIGMPATLFFTMGACRALLPPGPTGEPAWHDMPVSEGEGAGGSRDGAYRERGVAGFEELLESCAELGVRFIVCEMGLRAMDMERQGLRGDVPIEAAGIVTFLNDASADGSVVFV